MKKKKKEAQIWSDDGMMHGVIDGGDDLQQAVTIPDNHWELDPSPLWPLPPPCICMPKTLPIYLKVYSLILP